MESSMLKLPLARPQKFIKKEGTMDKFYYESNDELDEFLDRLLKETKPKRFTPANDDWLAKAIAQRHPKVSVELAHSIPLWMPEEPSAC